jgi:hypothetical protein
MHLRRMEVSRVYGNQAKLCCLKHQGNEREDQLAH